MSPVGNRTPAQWLTVGLAGHLSEPHFSVPLLLGPLFLQPFSSLHLPTHQGLVHIFQRGLPCISATATPPRPAIMRPSLTLGARVQSCSEVCLIRCSSCSPCQGMWASSGQEGCPPNPSSRSGARDPLVSGSPVPLLAAAGARVCSEASAQAPVRAWFHAAHSPSRPSCARGT